jgi:hypothetical protein
MSVSDIDDYQDLANNAATSVADQFYKDLAGLFEEIPDAFEGHSTKAEWQAQVDNAKEWLQDAIAHAIIEEIEIAETWLHDGNFLPATVACKHAAQVV